MPTKVERMTVRELIERLQAYDRDLPIVVESYEDGYDPVTHLSELTVTPKKNRYWYVGVYEKSGQTGESVLLISSKYSRTDLPTDDESDDTP